MKSFLFKPMNISIRSDYYENIIGPEAARDLMRSSATGRDSPSSAFALPYVLTRFARNVATTRAKASARPGSGEVPPTTTQPPPALASTRTDLPARTTSNDTSCSSGVASAERLTSGASTSEVSTSATTNTALSPASCAKRPPSVCVPSLSEYRLGPALPAYSSVSTANGEESPCSADGSSATKRNTSSCENKRTISSTVERSTPTFAGPASTKPAGVLVTSSRGPDPCVTLSFVKVPSASSTSFSLRKREVLGSTRLSTAAGK